MRVVVINTGTELLLGNVVNTHLAFLGQELFPLGLRISRQVTVPDGEAIRTALTESFVDGDIVILTGGLGPTTDDVTREITADLLGLELRHNAEVMAAITERAAVRGFRLTDRIPRQAEVPGGATVLANSHGTAPGLYLPPIATASGKSPHLFLLPGPPRELRPMFREKVLPLLRKIAPTTSGQGYKSYRLAGLGESLVEEAVGAKLLAMPGLEVGYCARPGEVDLRLIGPQSVLEAADSLITEKLGSAIFATDDSRLEEVVVAFLTKREETLALAESCTGGELSNRITNVSGASAVFLAGYVTYANAAKSDLLSVEASLIAEHGAVSEAVARAMAEGARRRAGSTHALATTGIAGPTGGSAEKPVGTVFLALASADSITKVKRLRFVAERETFKHLATQAALEMLRQRLRMKERLRRRSSDAGGA